MLVHIYLRNSILYRYFVIFPFQSHVKVHVLVISIEHVVLNWMEVPIGVNQFLTEEY